MSSTSMLGAIAAAELRADNASAVAQSTIENVLAGDLAAITQAEKIPIYYFDYDNGNVTVEKPPKLKGGEPNPADLGLVMSELTGQEYKGKEKVNATTGLHNYVDFEFKDKDRTQFDFNAGVAGATKVDPVADAAFVLTGITKDIKQVTEDIGKKFSLENLTSYIFTGINPKTTSQYHSPVYGDYDLASSFKPSRPSEPLAVDDIPLPTDWHNYVETEKPTLGNKDTVTYESPLYNTNYGGEAPSIEFDPNIYNKFFDAYETAMNAVHVPEVSFAPPDFVEFSYDELGQTELDAELAKLGTTADFLAALTSDATGGKLAAIAPVGLTSAAFEMARDREAGLFAGQVDGIHASFAARGFKIPQPASMALYDKASSAYTKALSSINRDLLLKQLELHTDLSKFAITTGIEINKLILDYTNKLIDRLLLAAEKAANYRIAYYNLKATLLKMDLEAAMLFTKIATDVLAGNLKRLDVFKASIAKIEVSNKNTSLSLEASKIQQDAGRLLVEEYKASMEESRLKLAYDARYLEVEKLSIAKFTALHNATAQETKTSIDLHTSEIQSYTALSSVEMQAAQVQAQRNETELAKARLELDAVKAAYERAALQAETAKTMSEIGVADANRMIALINAETSKYSATIDPIVTASTGRLNYLAAEGGNKVSAGNVAIEANKLKIDETLESRKIAIEAASAGMPVASSMVSAALSGIGTITSQASW